MHSHATRTSREREQCAQIRGGMHCKGGEVIKPVSPLLRVSEVQLITASPQMSAKTQSQLKAS